MGFPPTAAADQVGLLRSSRLDTVSGRRARAELMHEGTVRGQLLEHLLLLGRQLTLRAKLGDDLRAGR